MSKERVFFPARLEDNPTLMRNDPGYDARIRKMGPIEYSRLRENNWQAAQIKGALFKQEDFDRHRVSTKEAAKLRFRMIVVAVDPAATNTATSDEVGILVMGVTHTDHIYLLADESGKGSPEEWGHRVARAYAAWKANYVVAEGNQGGDMVRSTIHAVSGSIPVEIVHASRGKEVRLEPLSILSSIGKFHVVGKQSEFESEGRRWVPSGPNRSRWSPNRLDAAAHGQAKLLPAGVLDETRTDAQGKPSVLAPTEDARLERAAVERMQREDVGRDDGWGPKGLRSDKW